jgi:putative Mn2+ efflux pump MntP
LVRKAERVQSIPFVEVILISLGLSADAFSVALASGAQGFVPRRIFRLSWHFGLFQFLMPVIGWFGGEALAGSIGHLGKVVVLLILSAIGVKMIYEGLKPASFEPPDLSRGWKLVALSFGTSIDALGVGFGFGILGSQIWGPALMIGLICAAMTAVGLYLGACLYCRLGHKALIPGGLILVAIGIKMIF